MIDDPALDIRCENTSVSRIQNNAGTTGGVTGRGFMPGRSGNPGGRPKGLAKATRELVGDDGMALVELWWDIARDETRVGDQGASSHLAGVQRRSNRASSGWS